MAKNTPSSVEDQVVTEVPVDELRPISLDLIPQLRFVDAQGHVARLEERWYSRGTFDLVIVSVPKEEKADEPG